MRSFVRGFPGQPVFVVAPGTARPARLDSLRLEPVDHIVARLPMWRESDTQRPSSARTVPVDMTVWRVAGG